MLTYFLVDLYLLDVVRFTVAEVRFLGLVVLNFSVYLISFMVSLFVVTPHTQRERGKVIGVGVHLWTKKKLNRTLAIDSLFQTFAVRLLIEFID